MKSMWRARVVVAAACAACGGGGGGGSGVEPTLAADHPRIYLSRNRERLVKALTDNRPAAMRFKTSVDRWVSGVDVYNFEAWNAALLGQLTGDPKYCAAAIKAIDKQVSSAQSAISKGNAPAVASDSYLDVGYFVGDLALVYDWCAEGLTGSQRGAWLAYADQAVYNVWNPGDATWGGKKIDWSGWAVDDPSDNYYYSFLRATMLLGVAAHGEAEHADEWVTQFRNTKIADQLVPTFNADLVGGGSREGTGYGVSMRVLFHLYDVWAGSTGETISTLTGHTRASMLAFMHQTVPTLDRIAPTGDQSRDSTASFFDYHRNYLQELVALYPTDPLAGPARALLAGSSIPAMTSEFMFGHDFLYDTGDATAPLAGLGTAYYAPGIGELYARSSWDKQATWVNLIAGPYTQSHAHQDQGSLMIYKDRWLAYDAVIESHSGLVPNVDAHSTVRIVDAGGATVEQNNTTDAKVVALHQGPGFLHAAADLTPVYTKAKTVQQFQREIVYLEPDAIVVYDRVKTTGGTQVWQLVGPVSPTSSGSHSTFTYPEIPATKDTPKVPGHSLEVERVLVPPGTAPSAYDFTQDSDFSGGFRLDETAPAGDNRFLHVIWIDGAVPGAVTPGTDGVTLTTGGKTVVVQFNRGAIGGSVTIGDQLTTLGTGLDPLPELAAQAP